MSKQCTSKIVNSSILSLRKVEKGSHEWGLLTVLICVLKDVVEWYAVMRLRIMAKTCDECL